MSRPRIRTWLVVMIAVLVLGNVIVLIRAVRSGRAEDWSDLAPTIVVVMNVVGAAVIVVLLIALVVVTRRGRWPSWLGVGERRWKTSADEEVQPAKTAWDWLQLLIVPGMLVVIALYFSASQASREQSREDRRVREDRALAAAARQDDTLDSYMNEMRELILDRHLLQTPKGSQLRDVARSATLSALRRLDGERKGEVVRFLIEARLLSRRGFHIPGADLRGADLRGIGPTPPDVVNLARTDLRGARFDRAVLNLADFRYADLLGASFEETTLVGVRFQVADLTGADFTLAIISGGVSTSQPTSFESACVTNTSFNAAEFRRWVGQRWAGPIAADFSGADGDNVDFSAALGLRNVDAHANLTHVNLDGATGRPRGPSRFSTRGQAVCAEYGPIS
jgi:uncharacterized protein YjbI with pentapeptide repeats